MTTPIASNTAAFTAFFCASLERSGAIPPGLPLADVIDSVKGRPEEVLRHLCKMDAQPLQGLRLFHKKIDALAFVASPSDLEDAIGKPDTASDLSDEERTERYFEKLSEALIDGMRFFADKDEEVTWQRIFFAEERLAFDKRRRLPAFGRALNTGQNAADFGVLGLATRAVEIFESAIATTRGIDEPAERTRALALITDQALRADLKEKILFVFKALIAAAVEIGEEENRQEALRHIAKALPIADLGEKEPLLFETLAEATQTIRDAGYRRLVLEEIASLKGDSSTP